MAEERRPELKIGCKLPITMPTGDVVYVSEPINTDCVCKTRAATVKSPLHPVEGPERTWESKKLKIQTNLTIKHVNRQHNYRSFKTIRVYKIKNCAWKSPFQVELRNLSHPDLIEFPVTMPTEAAIRTEEPPLTDCFCKARVVVVDVSLRPDDGQESAWEYKKIHVQLNLSTRQSKNNKTKGDNESFEMVQVYNLSNCCLKRTRRFIAEGPSTSCDCKKRVATFQFPLRPGDGPEGAWEFNMVRDQIRSTIVEHNNNMGGVYKSFQIVKIFKLRNCCLWKRYKHCQLELTKEVGMGNVVERMLFHGSPKLDDIVNKGFDERYSYQGGYFGAGIYFASHSSKSNQYVMGTKGGTGCSAHNDKSCYQCERKLLLCRVLLGKVDKLTKPQKMSHAPPGYHSVEGVPSKGYLQYPEYVIYRGEQAYPEYLVTYRIVR